jgi:carbon storage regulator
MLVLTRKLSEKIVIGDDVVITVVNIERGKVKLGFDAPLEIPIFRSELIAADGPRDGLAHTSAAATPRHID